MYRWLLPLLFSVILTILHLVLFTSNFGERIEPLALDIWSTFGGSTPAQDVMIIAMDEHSYGTLGVPLNQAWPRRLHVELLNRLAEVQVKRAVFDVLFLGEGPDKKVDEELGKSIAKLPVVLGMDSIMRDQATASGSFRLEELLIPYDQFKESAEQLGLVGFPEDSGYVRRFLTDRTPMTKGHTTLSEGAAGFEAQDVRGPGPRDLIKLYGPRGSIQTFSYSQVIDPDHPLPKEMLKDKIVFVGLVLQSDTGPSQKDIFQTNFGKIFGSEIHASATLNLLHQDWIKRYSRGVEIALIGLVTLTLSFLLFILRPQWGGLMLMIVELSWFIGAYTLYRYNLFLPGLILVSGVLPLNLLLSSVYYYFVTRKAQLQVQSAFQHYVAPEMVAEIVKNESIGLGGEKVWATAMFTDIVGFTSITEELPAERVSAMLNAYFTEVMEVVFLNRGTLIKFIGDAVFVIWGAPVKLNNHAELACKTALAIQKEVDKFNASGRFPSLHTRVGVHTGPMVVGNLGSTRRFDYTAIGDAVNMASRVEGVNKYFGSKILITESTKKELGNSLITLPVGSIQVVGKKEALELHMLLQSDIDPEIRKQWLEALKEFRNREWLKAAELFHNLQNKEKILKDAAELYLDELAQLSKSPPSGEWQAALVLKNK